MHNPEWNLDAFEAKFNELAHQSIAPAYDRNNKKWPPERLEQYYKSLNKPMADFAEQMFTTIQFPQE